MMSTLITQQIDKYLQYGSVNKAIPHRSESDVTLHQIDRAFSNTVELSLHSVQLRTINNMMARVLCGAMTALNKLHSVYVMVQKLFQGIPQSVFTRHFAFLFVWNIRKDIIFNNSVLDY